MSLHPSLAAVRRGVRRELAGLGPGPVLVACSGGADSLALLAATVAETRGTERHVLGVTVDHALQAGSGEQAARVVRQMANLGVHETVTARVQVRADGHGPEAAAREARYAVLGELAQRLAVVTVLLGHTRDDQAETVLLGLTRGSGGRSLAGMRRRFVAAGTSYARPLLDVARDDTETACQVEGIAWWTDPHNLDPAFTRVRVRRTVLPLLEQQLGPGVAATLARTADQLRADSELLDDLADQRLAALRAGPDGRGLELVALQRLPEALLTRVLRRAALEAGALGAELFYVHVQELARLVAARTGGPGPTQVQLPGHVTAVRAQDRLLFRADPVTG
ncbi:MAG: tRNA lysidine(34) synthetase TilS [Nocardioides sp.]|nr:tRNA lysidine(34) synthetase TilS [Nocardioides sp.]